jgi:hypothetical protein
VTRPDENGTSRGEQTEQTTDGGNSGGQPTQAQQPAGQRGGADGAGGGLGELLASAAVRWGIGIAGFVLFLFAIGQAVGLNLLGMFAEALSSQTGQWLVVAVFALFLIAVARRGIVRTFRT